MARDVFMEELERANTASPPISIDSLEIDEKAKDIAKALQRGDNIFLTGAGGTGKTYLTRQILQAFRNPVILGTTALAAVLVGGETIHSFFKFRIAGNLQEMAAQDKQSIQWYMDKRRMSAQQARHAHFSRMNAALALADIVVIEEISMASGDLLDMIKHRLREATNRPIPILAVGDLMQLPPVNAPTIVYESPGWDFTTVNLEKIYRTDDLEFMQIQNKVRMGRCDPEVVKFLNDRRGMPTLDGHTTVLTARNDEVDAFNRRALAELGGEIGEYEARVGRYRQNLADATLDKFIQSIPPDKVLRLKEGARLMVTNNVYDEEKDLLYYNGQKGTFVGYEDSSDTLLLMTDDQGLKRVARFNYDMVENTSTGSKVVREALATVRQFPVRLAYAMTIHKSQGQTLDSIHINCRRIFAPGQFYVALSRATSPDRTQVSFFKPEHIKAEPKGLAFYQELKRSAG